MSKHEKIILKSRNRLEIITYKKKFLELVLNVKKNDDTHLFTSPTKPLPDSAVAEQQTGTGQQGKWQEKQEVASNMHY